MKHVLFRAEYKPRGYYLELWPQLQPQVNKGKAV